MSKIKSVLRAILKALAEGRFLHWVVQRIDKIGAWISRYLICRFTKVQKNTIVFMTYGNNYFCNPKYIAEEILRQKLPWRLVWVTAPKKGKAKRGDVPMEIEVVKRNSFEAIRATAQAKVWVDNAINFYWDRNPHKKKSQVYLQTWHGSMGIKRMGEDNVQSPRWVRTAKKTGKNTDYCISNSDFETMVFRTSYWKDEQANQILMYGHAGMTACSSRKNAPRCGRTLRSGMGSTRRRRSSCTRLPSVTAATRNTRTWISKRCARLSTSDSAESGVSSCGCTSMTVGKRSPSIRATII